MKRCGIACDRHEAAREGTGQRRISRDGAEIVCETSRELRGFRVDTEKNVQCYLRYSKIFRLKYNNPVILSFLRLFGGGDNTSEKR